MKRPDFVKKNNKKKKTGSDVTNLSCTAIYYLWLDSYLSSNFIRGRCAAGAAQEAVGSGADVLLFDAFYKRVGMEGEKKTNEQNPQINKHEHIESAF